MVINIQDSIVLITSNDPKNNHFGTGFVIAQDENGSYVASCAHVVRDVGGIDNVNIKNYPVKVIACGSEDGPDDVAILQITGLGDMPSLNLEASGKTGEVFIATGFQILGKQFLVRPLHGILGNEVGLECKGQIKRIKAWDLLIRDHYFLQPGYSGSPVVNEKTGNVLGIASYRIGEGQKGLAICIETLKMLDFSPDLSKQLFPSPPPNRKDDDDNHAKPYIVGRKEEVCLLDDIVNGMLPYHIVNIYGPGGIGKTVVCQKFEEWCRKKKKPYAMVTGTDPNTSTIRKILSQFKKGLEENTPKSFSGVFDEFAIKFEDYMMVEKAIDKGGGISEMFDRGGNPYHQKYIEERIEQHFAHRMILDRYRGTIDPELTNSFVQSVTHIIEDGNTKTILLIDTYEMMENLDDWMCETFVKKLPPAAKIIILGRDRLNRRNQNWIQHKEAIFYHELGELSEEEAKAYLCHHGLQDEGSLNRVYEFTRGYPLLLALAAELATELQGWEEVRDFQDLANRDRVAQQLLERILRQQKVEEVKEFLEKGVVTEWFDPGLVSHLLDVSPDRGREIYNSIGKFSFVSMHRNGLQFHDTVRKILLDRLKFTYAPETYKNLVMRYREYIRIRAGIVSE